MTRTAGSGDSSLTIRRAPVVSGRVQVPGDKSISHRALLLGALAAGESQVRGFLPSADCLATLACVRSLGVRVETDDARSPTTLTIHGNGLRGLQKPEGPLDCVRSGTTMRLLTGILAGQPFTSVLTGDGQLLRRPMRRVALPLSRMGAAVETTRGHGPLVVRGGDLQGREHRLPVPSAQVKSAILLAGLYGDGPTVVHQPGPARDHTELMLEAMGAELHVSGLSVTLQPPSVPLIPLDLAVPGDASSGAPLLVASVLLPGSRVTVQGVGVNPTRTGLLDVLREMGGDVVAHSRRYEGGEPVAEVTGRGSCLCGVEVSGETVVRMIDEFPLLAVAATQAQGTTVVRDAAELRVKETDRIAAIAEELGRMGARIYPRPDGFQVRGSTPLRGAVVDSHGDHRIAMALTVAGLLAEGETTLLNPSCITDSFPGFADTMRHLGAPITGP